MLPQKPITLVVYDSVGVLVLGLGLGLTLILDYPDQIDRLIIMNTALGRGSLSVKALIIGAIGLKITQHLIFLK